MVRSEKEIILLREGVPNVPFLFLPRFENVALQLAWMHPLKFNVSFHNKFLVEVPLGKSKEEIM